MKSIVWIVLAVSGLLGAAVLAWFLKEAGDNRRASEKALATVHRDADDLRAQVKRGREDLTEAAKRMTSLEDTLKTVSENAVEREGEITRLKDAESRLRMIETILRDPKSLMMGLKGTGETKDVTGRIAWTDEQNVVLFIALPELPTAKLYELWAHVEGSDAPLACGVYDAKGVRVNDFSKVPKGTAIRAWSITQEDKPVEKPEGPVIANSVSQ